MEILRKNILDTFKSYVDGFCGIGPGVNLKYAIPCAWQRFLNGLPKAFPWKKRTLIWPGSLASFMILAALNSCGATRHFSIIVPWIMRNTASMFFLRKAYQGFYCVL